MTKNNERDIKSKDETSLLTSVGPLFADNGLECGVVSPLFLILFSCSSCNLFIFIFFGVCSSETLWERRTNTAKERRTLSFL